jgi:hypothetical protein
MALALSALAGLLFFCKMDIALSLTNGQFKLFSYTYHIPKDVQTDYRCPHTQIASIQAFGNILS